MRMYLVFTILPSIARLEAWMLMDIVLRMLSRASMSQFSPVELMQPYQFYSFGKGIFRE